MLIVMNSCPDLSLERRRPNKTRAMFDTSVCPQDARSETTHCRSEDLKKDEKEAEPMEMFVIVILTLFSLSTKLYDADERETMV